MIMPFGQYKDKTLEEIANKDILYLDRIVEFMREKNMNFKYVDFYEELKAFLKRPDISKRIDEAMESKEEISYSERPYDSIPKKWWDK